VQQSMRNSHRLWDFGAHTLSSEAGSSARMYSSFSTPSLGVRVQDSERVQKGFWSAP